MTADLAVDQLRRWKAHPEQFVREVFGASPDPWQDEVLIAFPTNPAMVMMCNKGPGKTACLAWLAWNFLVTRPFPKIAATSSTADNLRDGLWSEMAKWMHKSPMLEAAFEWTASKIFAKDHPETWFMTARAWSRSADATTQGETLAGIWADNIVMMLDEAGAIPPAVLSTAQVVTANANQQGKDAHVLLAGNCNSIQSAMYDAAVTHRSQYHVTHVTGDPDDPKRSPRIPIEFARAQIAEYGRDNPWVMVNILAQFPRQGLNSLISADEVIAAQRRHYPPSVYESFPRIMGVDVARFGDDATVIWRRQGKASFVPWEMRGLDTVQVAGHVMARSNEWRADSIQIDSTGGYGAGVLDVMRGQGYANALGVGASDKAREDAKYHNKRAEVWFNGCQWIKDGGVLPPVPDMVKGLSTATYSFKGDRLLIESKDQMKARLRRSPDHEDAFFCTFGHPVAPRPSNTIVDLAIQASQHIRGLPDDVYDRRLDPLHNPGLEHDPWRNVNG